MQIALTGATGSVGATFALAARARNHAVVGLVRDRSRASELTRAGVELVVGDLDDADSLQRLVRGADAVVHTAAHVGDAGPARHFEQVNVEGTRNVLEAAGAATVRRFVQLSSVAYYGMPEFGTIDETFPPQSVDEPYAVTKRFAEELVFRRGGELGLEVCAVRPPIIFGERDRVFLPRVVEQLRLGRALYVDHGRAPLNVVSARDVVDVLLRCVESPHAAGHAFNVAAWPPPSIKDVFEAIADGASLPRPTRSLPKSAAMLLARTLEGGWKLTSRDGSPPLTPFVVRRFTRYVVYDASKARRLLGWAGGDRALDEMRALAAAYVASGSTNVTNVPPPARDLRA